MGKKLYVKPEFKMIALRPEERLAACEYYYKTGLSGGGCYSKFFPVDEPAACTITITPSSVS